MKMWLLRWSWAVFSHGESGWCWQCWCRGRYCGRYVAHVHGNCVIPGTNASCDLICVTFLIWDGIMWALGTQQNSSVTSGAPGQLRGGASAGCDHPRNRGQVLSGCTAAHRSCQSLLEVVPCNGNCNCTACWEGISHFVTWCIWSQQSQDSSSTDAAMSICEHEVHRYLPITKLYPPPFPPCFWKIVSTPHFGSRWK